MLSYIDCYFFRFISNIKSGTKHNFKELISRVKDLVIFSILAIYYFTESLILTFTPAFLRKEKCLKDRVVLITGGAGGIGREMVLRLAKQGAKVIVWDQKESGKWHFFLEINIKSIFETKKHFKIN